MSATTTSQPHPYHLTPIASRLTLLHERLDAFARLLRSGYRAEVLHRRRDARTIVGVVLLPERRSPHREHLCGLRRQLVCKLARTIEHFIVFHQPAHQPQRLRFNRVEASPREQQIERAIAPDNPG